MVEHVNFGTPSIGPAELVVLLVAWLIPLLIVLALLTLVIRMVRAQEQAGRALREIADHLGREGGTR